MQESSLTRSQQSTPHQETRDAASGRRFCVAPMMQLTDRHDRYLLRLLSRNALLYTEMLTADALLRGSAEQLLRYSAFEHPLALQLGGSEAEKLSQCASLAEQFGFDEVNLNVGCPSDRVQSGRFGACLMLEPELVADCFSAMQSASTLPITIKCRIGVDEQEPAEVLPAFAATLSAAGCKTIIVHARKAWLKGLSPKENRDVPPLDYALVYRLKQQFPELEIVINGGIESVDQAQTHLQHVDGVMLGRSAYHQPWVLADVDHLIFDAPARAQTRIDVLQQYMEYMETEIAAGTRLHHMARHVLGLFHGVAGARRFRRHLSETMFQEDAGIAVVRDAYNLLEHHQGNI